MLPVACVAVINGVIPKIESLLSHCANSKNKCLLIADECHRYIEAPVFSRIRHFPFDYTLGLSATLFDYNVPGIGKIVYEYSFKQAYRDNLIPPFDLVNISVKLTRTEKDEYFRLDDRLKKQFQKVNSAFECDLEGVNSEHYFKKLKKLMNRDGVDNPEIRKLFLLLFKRAELVHLAEEKINLSEKLTRLLVDHGRKKVVVFFERIQSAEDAEEGIDTKAANRLLKRLDNGDSIWCRVYHSGLSKSARESVLDEFREIGPSALLACRSLDEGVDIPQVNAAILAASTQSKRQRIQRIGRTLRKGDGTKRPLIVTLYVAGTNDENVTQDDRETFKGVATFHDESQQTCVKKIQELM